MEPCWTSISQAGKTTYGTLNFEGKAIPMTVTTGQRPGPVVLMTGMQHGTEFSGPAALDRVLATIDPGAMTGTLVGLPFVNPFHARLTPEEHGRMHREPSTNLNRQWQNRKNSENPLTRLADFIWESAIRHADALVDMHCCRDNDPRFAACLDGHAPSEALAEAAGFEAVDRQNPGSYDARQLMLAAALELDIPAILVESYPSPYQTPEAVEACAHSLFRTLAHMNILPSWKPEPVTDPTPGILRRADKGHALRAQQAGYLAIRRFPGRPVGTGQAIVEIRSMETFAVIESLVSPIDGAVDAVAEFSGWPFVSPGDLAASVKPRAPARLAQA